VKINYFEFLRFSFNASEGCDEHPEDHKVNEDGVCC